MKFSTFFSNVQESPWYRHFLNPVIDEIPNNTHILDIGTGTGKMLEILSKEKNVSCIGADTSADMLHEAKEKLINTDTKLYLIKAGKTLPFKQDSFDYITFCSVLFHLKNDAMVKLLADAMKLLKNNGVIIVHTPTGTGGLLKLTKCYFSIKNSSMYLWYHLTKKRAMRWTDDEYISKYAREQNLNYERKLVMNGFAQIEIIKKSKIE